MQVGSGGPTMQVDAGGPTMQVTNPGNANAVTAGQIGQTNLDPYMNPYTQSVINATLPAMLQANALSQNQQGNAANSANAFGGSRQGVQQGVAQAQGAMNVGQMVAGLNSANFTQAQAAATGDINRNLTAQQANQSSQQADLSRQNADALANQTANAGDLQRSLSAQTANQTANAGDLQRSLAAQTSNQTANAGDLQRSLAAQTSNQSADQTKINSDIAASQGLANTGDSMNKANVANFNLLQSAGAGQSMQSQNDINAQMAKFNQAFNYPQQQLGTLESSLGMTPHDTTSEGSSTSSTTTPTDWADIISKGAGAAANIYGMGTSSDETMKTDIVKLGKDPKTGLEMHSFRYKGDPKSYPKVVGPMAQDVEKRFPGSTTPMGKEGKLAITKPIPQGFAAGTPFVGQPSLAAFTPPSSPSVAKGMGALAAFRPPTRLPRGVGIPKMQHFDEGTADVQPAPNQKVIDGLKKISALFDDAGSAPAAAPAAAAPIPGGWNQPSMGYAASGFARGTPMVPPGMLSAPPGMPPGPTDTVPAMLTPGEAVLTPRAAQHVGRHNIASLNAMMPPIRQQAASMPRAGARGVIGALANTKLRPRTMGALSV